MKIQTQTALLFTVLAAAVGLLLYGVIYYAAKQNSANDFKKRLELRAIVASKIRFTEDTSSSATYNELRERYLEFLPNEQEYIVKVDPVSRQLIVPAGLSVPNSFFEKVRISTGTEYYDRDDTFYAGRPYFNDGIEYLVITSAVNLYGREGLTNLKRILFIAFFGQVVLVFTVSFLFSRKAFQPFRDIIAKVNIIGVENMSLRLREKKGKDEIADLTHTFNRMLDRLQTAFDIQNNFVSNASHELRTPLTTIIGEAEIALSKTRTPAEYEASLNVILQQAEKLEALTSALLSLAQSGVTKNREDLALVRMDELLFEVQQTIDRIDPENQVQVDLEQMPPTEDLISVRGNAELLKLAISNIILNACKYSNNNQVLVKLGYNSPNVELEVSDQGIGIPDVDLKHVFVPFFRASNTGSFKGYGVGLPLSMNIIRQHNGIIKMDSEVDKGTRVLIQLPVASS